MKAKKPRKAEKQDEKQRRARKPRKQGHSRDYEKKRRDEGKRYKKRMRHLRRVLREFGKGAGIGDLVALIHILVARAWHNMSYRSHAACLQIHPGEARKCGFKRTPSKSTLHRMASRVAGMGAGALHAMVIGMALLCLPGRARQDKDGLVLRFHGVLAQGHGTVEDRQVRGPFPEGLLQVPRDPGCRGDHPGI